jgi:hypothetical protein
MLRARAWFERLACERIDLAERFAAAVRTCPPGDVRQQLANEGLNMVISAQIAWALSRPLPLPD